MGSPVSIRIRDSQAFESCFVHLGGNLINAHLLLCSLSSFMGYEVACFCMCVYVCVCVSVGKTKGGLACVGEDLFGVIQIAHKSKN